MTTIKLKKNLSAAPRKESRGPLRPTGVKRPHQTLAQAQAEAQAERDQRRKRWEDRAPQGADRAPQWGDRPPRDGNRPPREGEQRPRFVDRHRDDRRPPPRATGPHRAPPQGERPSQPAWAKPQPTGRGAYNAGPRGPQSDTRPGPRYRDDRPPRAQGDRPPRPYGQGQSQGDGHTNTYGHRDRQAGPSAERRPYPPSDRRPAPPADRQRTAPHFDRNERSERNDRDVRNTRNDRNDNRQPPRFADRDRRPPGAQDRRPPYAEDRPPASGFGRNDRRPPPMDRQRPPARADERRPYSPPHSPPHSPTYAPNQRPAAMPERRPAMPPHPSQAQATPGAETELPRLSKRMSELGLASRREADDWIARGLVRVDGVVVDQLGTRVAPNQHITIDPEAHNEQSKLVTILLHKPLGIVSGQAEDGHAPAATLINAGSRWPGDHQPRQFHPSQLHHLVPAGRLDLDSTGLLVLTQDGRVAKMLIGADTKVEKEYVVEVAWTEQPDATNLKDSFPADKLELLRNGLELDRQPLKPAKVSWQNETHLRFVLREGKRRQIRRMCEAVGLQVVSLKRIRIGRVGLGDMAPGQWRYLGPFESFL